MFVLLYNLLKTFLFVLTTTDKYICHLEHLFAENDNWSKCQIICSVFRPQIMQRKQVQVLNNTIIMF